MQRNNFHIRTRGLQKCRPPVRRTRYRTARNRMGGCAEIVPRDAWLAVGKMGMLCPDVPEEYGGPGGDFLFNAIVHEELARGGAHSLNACLIAHSDIIAAYLLELGSEEQKKRWLPKMVSGEAIAAIGMSEPGAGSDLKSIRTSVRSDGQGGYVLSGQKTFITNGHNADLVVVACKSSDKGISLFIVDTTLPGFRRGRLLEKIGQKAGDTAELSSTIFHLPAAMRSASWTRVSRT